MTMENKKTKTRNDLILLGVVVLLAAGWFLWRALSPAETGGEVVIQKSGMEYVRLPLAKDTEYQVFQGEDLQMTVVIRDGIADATQASCPDKLCVHQADISKNGEMIVCLPNEILVIVEGGEANELDSIAQ